VRDGIFLMTFSGIFMFVIGIYLELAMPKTYGKRKHPLFFIGCPWSCKNKNKQH
jgi:hypothetical protein